KAERRAEHNAVERARRENLNSKFQQLADSLPNLRSYRRPSKGQIVEKALDWIRQSMHKESRYRHQIYQLQRQNKQLLAQLDQPQDRQLSPPL
ncbi:Myc-type, basic helix-loop-helix domain-containing protein, partial [Chlamydoabsidia padenii]